ncbi:MAG: tetratricopeptide repeat protein [Treponema sp.]|nr:tetratricopeptide repeat protein [Treponema sp.]
MLVPILVSVIVASALVVVIMLLSSGAKGKKGKPKSDSKVQKKGKSGAIKDYEKRLNHNPHDVIALEALGDIYYEGNVWDKVWGVYKTLYEISAAHIEISVPKSTRRMGIAAYNLGKYDDALNSFMISLRKEPDVYETNLYLGKTFYAKQTYDKAIICFKKCRLIKPDSTEVVELLGRSLFQFHKYKECLPYLKKVLDEQPDNKELLFNMAVAMSESGIGDKALKIFVHLRPDPVYGAQSCLEAGKMHERNKNIAAALQDYEIGLKLQGVPEQIAVQIKYRCAQCYINQHNIQKGLTLLKQIQNSHSGYKDVDALVKRYAELASNQNLQTYLLSGTSEFVALCRKLIASFFKDAYVKVEDVSVASESVEILCSVESAKWEAKELFRFYRNSTVIGDIYVREFHSKMRDSKCDNGYCVTMSSFSDSAHKYVEGRPIDLIEKDQLCVLLKKINLF